MSFLASQAIAQSDHIILRILPWFALLQAFYSCIVLLPPEPAMFRAHDNLELNFLSRPLHVILLTGPYWLSLKEYADIFSIIQFYCLIGMSALPIIWFLGILPPTEAFFLWAIEQAQIFLFGGTPSSNLPRSCLQIALSCLHFALVSLLVPHQGTVDFFHIFCFASKHQAFITCVAKVIFRMSQLMIWHQNLSIILPQVSKRFSLTF